MAPRQIEFAGQRVPSNLLCIVCVDVLDRSRRPTIVVHHRDGTFQPVCGAVHVDIAEFRPVGLGHLLDRLPDAAALPLLEPSHQAEQAADGTWVTSPEEE